MSEWIVSGIRTTKTSPATITIWPLSHLQVDRGRGSTDLRSGISNHHRRVSQQSCHAPCPLQHVTRRGVLRHMMVQRRYLLDPSTGASCQYHLSWPPAFSIHASIY